LDDLDHSGAGYRLVAACADQTSWRTPAMSTDSIRGRLVRDWPRTHQRRRILMTGILTAAALGTIFFAVSGASSG